MKTLKMLPLLLLCTFSCSHIAAKKKQPQLETPNSKLKTDSILQFSVMITAIFEDSDGNFWFGSHGDGLCRYDGEKYTYFMADNGLPNGNDREFAPGPDWSIVRKINGGNQIQAINEDKAGNLWVMTTDHISRFNGEIFESVESNYVGPLPINLSAKEWKTFSNDFIFGYGSQLGVFSIKRKKLIYHSFPPPFDKKRDGVSAYHKDLEGNFWFGTMENGSFHYDGKTFESISNPHEIGISRSIFQDKNKRIWITNNQFGLNYLEHDTLVNFIIEYSQLTLDTAIIGEFKTGFQAIEQGENGDLWFGTFGNGLWQYNGEKLLHHTNNNDLEIIVAKTIYKDRSGKLWFGLNEGSVYAYDSGKFKRFDEIQLLKKNLK